MQTFLSPGRAIIIAALIIAAPLVFLATNGGIASGNGASLDNISAEERARIETIVREYILANPEILPEAIEILQNRAVGAAISENRDAILDDPGNFVIGNPAGDVTIVEFFDYTCGYCKVMKGPLQRLLADDKGVRIILKEWPIRGEVAELASRAAIAARSQNRYEDFHLALFERPGRLTEDAVFETAEKIGLDTDRLRAGMTSSEVTAIIERNRQLGAQLGLRGTPAFIIGDELVAGAISYEQLRAKVRAAREATGS